MENHQHLSRYPETEEEAEKLESLIEERMANLSFEEQEKIIFSIYGLPTSGDEEEEHNNIDDQAHVSDLHQLDTELNNIQEKPAYDLAVAQHGDYVKNATFQKLFLLAERGNVSAAAKRIVRHFQVKQLLFGDKLLAKDINFHQLSAEEREVVKSGCMQICPRRDASGRTVILLMTKEHEDWQAVSRAYWFLIMSALKFDSDDTQQNSGYVIVKITLTNQIPDLAQAKHGYDVLYSLPTDLTAAHFCYSNPALRLPILGLQAMFYIFGTFQSKFHYGNPKELEFKLQTYGIDTQCIPFYPPTDDESCYCTEWHTQWVENVLKNETENGGTISPAILVPGKFDVLFGKSKQSREHTGNLRCLVLIEMNAERYEQATKVQKSHIADEIISIIHGSKGRFLKQRKGLWMEVSRTVAKDKVAHFFRNRRLQLADQTVAIVEEKKEIGS